MAASVVLANSRWSDATVVRLTVASCIAVACAALTACATGPEASMRSKDRLTTFGANPQFDNERYEMVDLITLLDPRNLREGYPESKLKEKATDLFALTALDKAAAGEDAAARHDLAMAEIAFYDARYRDPETRRNRVQDRLIGASNQRCAAYKVYLNRFDAYVQSGFGSATTLLGGAAAIVGGVKDARILGGLAGISSGTQAEISQGFLGNLASYVIVPGMELRRKTIFDEIQMRRQDPNYTLQAALADVARYHGACTLVVGLEQAKEAIQTVDNPGMKMMGITLNNVLQTRAMQQAIVKQDHGPLAPADLVIPSFRINDQVVSAGSGQAGVRYTASSAAGGAKTPDGLSKQVSELGAASIATVDDAKAVLGRHLAAMQAEIDKNGQDAWAAKWASVRSAAASRVDALAESRKALATAAVNNTGAAAAALACLAKLDERVNASEPAQRDAATTDRDLGSALVAAELTRWLEVHAKTLTTWTSKLTLAIDGFNVASLKDKAPGDVDPAKLGAELDQAVKDAPSTLDGFPAMNFKARGITACP